MFYEDGAANYRYNPNTQRFEWAATVGAEKGQWRTAHSLPAGLLDDLARIKAEPFEAIALAPMDKDGLLYTQLYNFLSSFDPERGGEWFNGERFVSPREDNLDLGCRAIARICATQIDEIRRLREPFDVSLPTPEQP